MTEISNNQKKKEIMKDIIRKLHQGLTIEEAKERFEKEIGAMSSTEIAEMEQALISEGLSPEEIKKFCNVHALLEEPVFEGDEIRLPTGKLRLKELMSLLNTLPVDITFVDNEDEVRYFSDNKERIFMRTKSVLGIKVQNCHPPQSLDAVEKILRSFKEGKRDMVDFWVNLEGKFVYIRYFAVRDKEGSYLGTLEVSQDLTEIKKLEGEKRLDA
jgi:PAS domain S-box-containing protein